MNLYFFNKHNTNAFTVKYQEMIDFTYHQNKIDFPYFHTHSDYWEFTIVISGSLINEKEDHNETCDTNYLFITPTNINHRIIRNNDKNEELNYLNIIVREERIKKMASSIFDSFFDFLSEGSQETP